MNFHEFIHAAVDPANYHWTWQSVPKLFEAFFDISLGAFVLSKNPRALANRAYFAMTSSVFIWLCSYSWAGWVINPHLHIFIIRGFSQLGVTAISPGVFFFTSSMLGLAGKRKRWILTGYLAGFSYYLLFNLFPASFFPDEARVFSWGLYDKTSVYYAAFFPFFFGLMMWSFLSYWRAYRSTTSLIEKNRIKYVFVAFLVAYVGSVDWLPGYGINVYPFGYIPLFFFDVILAYTIVSHKLFDIETVYFRTIVWAVTSLVVLAPLGLMLVFLRPWLSTLSSPGLIGVCSGLYILFLAYTNYIQPKIDELFQRRRYDLNRALIEILPELAEFKQLPDLAGFLSYKLGQILASSEVAVFIHDEDSNEYRPFPAQATWSPLKPANGNASLLNTLQESNQVMLKEEVSRDPSFPLKNAELLTSFNSEGKMLGFLVVGRKLNGKPYKQSEIDFLNRLRTSAAIAISNSLLIDKVLEFEKLTQVSEAKTAFVSMVSHEFRNPLNAMRGFVELLRMAKVDRGTRGKYLEIVGTETERLMRLVNDLLDLAKLDKGGMELQRVAVDMRALAQETITELQVSYPKLKFKVEVSGNISAFEGDRDKLKQVLMNLLSNASKYSPEEGMVTVALSQEHESLRFYVEDEGAGIPEDLQPRIFEKFARLEATNYKRKPGAGLGMAITKALVELHGGIIGIESPVKDWKGTRFWVELPAA